MIDALEKADISWCAIGGIAVNHWAEEPMVTRDVDIVVTADDVDRTVKTLEEAGFQSERYEWSVEDTVKGKIRAWRDPSRRQSERLKDLGDTARLTEANPELLEILPEDVKDQLEAQ